jgi:NAD(P)-dependent dehydrogenase (short-subunit alcohol dehydrogenase family)
MAGLVALTRSAMDELSPFGIRLHAVGRGLEKFQSADAGVPRRLVEAVTYLCGNPVLNGQIVDVEA